jgi:hypothetical protein
MNLSDTQVKKIAEACLAVGRDAVDEQGFVAVRSLLARFEADLVLRPMLVEAMLCKASDTQSAATASRQPKWRLLVDSETYNVPPAAIDEEAEGETLPPRFRNTVAHELTHSLAFRAKEFGVELTLQPSRSPKETPADFVSAVERCTEQMSPLLLVPDASIDRWFPASLSSLSIDRLTSFRRSVGISRHVLVQRLNLLPKYGNHLFFNRQCFSNVAVGIGTWTHDRVPMLQAWPLFAKFERHDLPTFIHALLRAKSSPSQSIVSDPAFVLNGGDRATALVETSFGPRGNPAEPPVIVEMSVEARRAGNDAAFLFLARVLPRAS